MDDGNISEVLGSYFRGWQVVPVGSGTAALSLALRLLGAEGRKVVLPAFGCSNLVVAARAAGAMPVLADVDPETANLDPSSVADVVDNSVAAVVVVHSFGQRAALGKLAEIVAPFDCSLIEDACQGYREAARSAELAPFGVVSFGYSKPVDVEGGGLLLCQSVEMAREAADRVREWSVGLPASWKNRIAVGCMQTDHDALFTWLARRLGLLEYRMPPAARRRLPESWRAYRAEEEQIAVNLREIAFAIEADGRLSLLGSIDQDRVPWRLSFLCESEEHRRETRGRLREVGVRTTTLYRPLSQRFPELQGEPRLRNSRLLARRVVNLVYCMAADETRLLCRRVRAVLEHR